MHTPHRMTAGYDSVEQAVTVTVPGRTLADALATTPEEFETFAETMADAATVIDGFGESFTARWDGLYGAREQLAQEISGGDPNRKGREITLDTDHALELIQSLMAVVVDRSLVHDTASVRAAWALVGRVRNDEQIAELQRTKAIAAATSKAAA